MKGVYAAIVTHFASDLTVDHDAVAGRSQAADRRGRPRHRSQRDGRREAAASRPRSAARCSRPSTPPRAVSSRVRGRLGNDRRAGGRCTRVTPRSAGADGAMTLPPLLYRADERELVEFFGSVARATELPMMVYNNPLGSGSDIQPELLARIAARGAAHHRVQGDLRGRAADRRAGGPVPRDRRDGRWRRLGARGAVRRRRGLGLGRGRRAARAVGPAVGAVPRRDLAAARELYAELLPLARLDMTPKLVQYFKAASTSSGSAAGRAGRHGSR